MLRAARPGLVAAGAESDAEVLLAAPVDEVVARLGAGAREVADLVVREAGGGEPLAHEPVLHELDVVGLGRDAPLRAHARQRSARLVGEAVGGDVLEAARDRASRAWRGRARAARRVSPGAANIRSSERRCEAGVAQQLERAEDVRRARARGRARRARRDRTTARRGSRDRRRRRAGASPSPRVTDSGFASQVHSSSGLPSAPARGSAARSRTRSSRNASCGSESDGRRAAAEVDRAQRRAARHALELERELLQVGIRARRVVGRRREVAVGAAADAERDVDVERAGRAPARGRAAPARLHGSPPRPGRSET